MMALMAALALRVSNTVSTKKKIDTALMQRPRLLQIGGVHLIEGDLSGRPDH